VYSNLCGRSKIVSSLDIADVGVIWNRWTQKNDVFAEGLDVVQWLDSGLKAYASVNRILT
jgi:hypothetical protein